MLVGEHVANPQTRSTGVFYDERWSDGCLKQLSEGQNIFGLSRSMDDTMTVGTENSEIKLGIKR